MASIYPEDDMDGSYPEFDEEIEEQETPEGMTDQAIESAVRNAVSDAENYIQNDVSPDRLRASEYYNGECFIPAEENRSSFVSMTVRDTIEAMVPNLMKTFVGAEYLVSASANTADRGQQAAAADATEAFNDVFWKQNAGWDNLEGFSRDALMSKIGVFKAQMIDTVTVSAVDYEGTEEEFNMIAQSEGVTVNEAEGYDDAQEMQTPIGPVLVSNPMVDADLTVKQSKRKLEISVVAPENFLINRSATSLEHGGYTLVGEATPKLVSDVVAMGVPLEDAQRYAGSGQTDSGDYQEDEARARRDQSTNAIGDDQHTDPSTRPIMVYDLFMRMDADGDGIAELRHIVGIGENIGMVIENEIVKDHPYSVSSAISIPHAVIGHSVAENVTDLQDVNTQLTRAALNNIAQVQNPRPIVGPNDKDALISVLDNRAGAPVKAQPGSIDWLVYPFVGGELLGVLNHFQDILGQRTGMNPENMGLDAKALQASSEVGVLAVLGAGLTQPEMITATIANRAITRLFMLVTDLLREEGTPLEIMSKGEFKEVNPAEWPEDMRLTVHVGLGTGRKEEKLAALMQTAALQKEILVAAYSTGGTFNNAFVTPEQYSRTLHQIGDLSNLGQTSAYWKTPEEVKQYLQQEAQAKQQAEANKPPDPPPLPVILEQMKAQSAQMKTEADNQTKVMIQSMNDENDIVIQAMKDDIDRMQAQLEATLAMVQAQQGEDLTSNDVNIEG